MFSKKKKKKEKKEKKEKSLIQMEITKFLWYKQKVVFMNLE